MGRSTSRHVTKTDVSTSEVRTVFNSDKSSRPIPPTNRKASDFFSDGDVENSIYNDFIDPDEDGYVIPGEGQTKKDVLASTTDLKWGDWRNYGGEEPSDGICEIPEIYWASILTKRDTECVAFSTEILDYISQNNHYITINTVPDLEEVISILGDAPSNNGFYADGQKFLNAFNNNESSNISDLATKVGLDYNGSLPACGKPEFKVKVTPYIAEPISTIFTKTNLSVGIGIDTVDAGIPLTLGAFLDAVITTGYKDIFSEQVAVQKYGLDSPAMKGLIGSAQPKQFAVQLSTFGQLFSLLAVADVIWQQMNPDTAIDDILYQYRKVVVGNYRYEDIRESTYSIGVGNKFYFDYLQSLYTPISPSGTIHEFSVDNPNFSGEFDEETNKISLYPQNTQNHNKYLNFKFFPKAYQYDYNIPPPIVEYFIELIPVKYCILSSTKPTSFSVRICPYKYIAPKFDIIIGSPDRKMYLNTTATFQNAKFVDFLFFKQAQKDFTGQYYNFTINTDGNANAYLESFINKSTSFFVSSTGNNVIFKLNQLSNIYDYIFSPRYQYSDFLGKTGKYFVYFMNEYERNIIFNPKFRVEQSDDTALHYAELRKFWTYDDITIGDGRANIIGSSAFLSQELPELKISNFFTLRFYTLKLSITINSGSAYLNYADTCFEGILYSPYSINSPLDFQPERGFLPPSYISDVLNMEIDRKNFIFSQTGDYTLILRTNSDVSKQLLFTFSPDFNGYISNCSLQYLPNKQIGVPDTNAFNFVGNIVNYLANSTRNAFDAVTFNGQPRTVKSVEIVREFLSEGNLTLYFKDDKSPGTLSTYELSIVLPPNHSAVLYKSFNYSFGTIPPILYEEYDNVNDYIINISESTTMTYTMFKLKIINHYTGGDFDLRTVKINSLESHDIKLIGLTDDIGLLVNSQVDLSDSGFGKKIYIPAQKNRGNYPETWAINHGTTREFIGSLHTLNLSGTPIEQNFNELYATRQTVKSIIPITNTVDFSNTKMSGYLVNLLSAETVLLDSTDIVQYGFGQPDFETGSSPYIVWKNSNTTIDVEQLHYLLLVLDDTGLENGTLDISGNNPEITDLTALDHIASLVSKGWNITYNPVSIPVITLVGDNPLAWNLGETFVDPGATAYDAKDGDITADIVAVSTVDINTEGAYQVTYNVTDSDGNSAEEVVRVVNVAESGFPEVTIGTQTWTLKNLDIDDGLGGIYAYNDDVNNIPIYGRLYTWDAAVRVAASIDGWHLPSDAEWQTLSNYLEGNTVAGGKLKETGFTHWKSPNTGATNETGFTALPGGYRYYTEIFNYIGKYGYWWSSTEYNESSAYSRLLYYNRGDLGRYYSSGGYKECGFSVRLVKDS